MLKKEGDSRYGELNRIMSSMRLSLNGESPTEGNPGLGSCMHAYIDAFCGRTPKSVLARHYSDYSSEKLKQIYDKANLKVLQ